MKLLIDEMHSPRVAAALRAEGCDVLAVAEEGTLRGSSDAHLFEFATETGRAVVTEDTGGFVGLAHRSRAEGKPHCGLIITNRSRFHRGSAAYPNNLAEALRSFLASPPFEGDTWVWWLS